MNTPQWMPMGTAPRDGTRILAATKYDGMFVVWYDNDEAAPWRIVNNFGVNEFALSQWTPLPVLSSGQNVTSKTRTSNLLSPHLTLLITSVLVKRLGGVSHVTQDDIDAVAYNTLHEESDSDGNLELRLVERRFAE